MPYSHQRHESKGDENVSEKTREKKKEKKHKTGHAKNYQGG